MGAHTRREESAAFAAADDEHLKVRFGAVRLLRLPSSLTSALMQVPCDKASAPFAVVLL